ncbi:MAG: PEP-CTERM sorting domain-containing protein, partial [Phycisphaerae bacterium]|nr:PEP-CTERM sorting domain-containing protein [Phycisphaerae bacterium]
IDVQSGATFDVSAKTAGFAVGASQTLEGVGTVSTGGHALTIDGTVAPGDASMGTLTIDPASMVFGPSSVLTIDAVGAANDLLAVDGNLNLSGAGDTLNFVGTPTANLYTIVTYTGTLTGTFANLNLQGYTVNYGTGSNSSITLSRSSIPEPASLGLLAVGGLGILLLGKRRRV